MIGRRVSWTIPHTASGEGVLVSLDEFGAKVLGDDGVVTDLDREDLDVDWPCPLCESVGGERVHGGYIACACGLVYRPGAAFSAAEPSEGWRLRAANIAVETPKSALRCPSVEGLAAALSLGPVYIETPNTREPALSLSHFFRSRHACYYEAHTLAVAASMAGASDMAVDQQAGHLCAVIIPGDARRTYAEALEIFGESVPTNVAHRMAHAFDRKEEVLGDVVDGACFLCGGTRRSWRTAAICTVCSTLTSPAQPPVIDELAVSFSSAEPMTERSFIAPSMRTTSPDDCEAIVQSQGFVLDDPGWTAALLRAGADMCAAEKRTGTLMMRGMANGPPRRKSIAEARELMREPFREGRHTLAIWSLGPPTASRFECWLAGDEEADVEYLRREALRMHEVTSAALSVLDAIIAHAEAAQADPDDWHADEEIRGVKMGRQAAWMAVHSLASAASAELMGRALK